MKFEYIFSPEIKELKTISLYILEIHSLASRFLLVLIFRPNPFYLGQCI